MNQPLTFPTEETNDAGEQAKEQKDQKGSIPAPTLNAIERIPGLGQIDAESIQIRPATRIEAATNPRGPGADRFRLLRTHLYDMRKVAKLQTLFITSPLPKDGKSTVTLNLATALSHGSSGPVLVVEADLHQPGITSTLGLPMQAGFAECIEDGTDPLSVLTYIQPLNWYLLAAGHPRGNPKEIIYSAALQNVLKTLCAHFDWILLDTPPVIPLNDALALSKSVDGGLMVVRAEVTPRGAVDDAIARIGKSKLVGVVLNGEKGLNSLYSKYTQYYGSEPTNISRKLLK